MSAGCAGELVLLLIGGVGVLDGVAVLLCPVYSAAISFHVVTSLRARPVNALFLSPTCESSKIEYVNIENTFPSKRHV
jgi:hypothetical protein